MEDKNQDNFNYELLKELSIADLKASMDYFYSEFEISTKESSLRFESIKLIEEAIKHNKKQLKDCRSSSLKSVLIKEIIYPTNQHPYIHQSKVILSNKNNRNLIVDRLKKEIDLYIEYLDSDTNGDEDGTESLNDLTNYANFCLDKYYYFKNELANRFYTNEVFSNKNRITAKQLLKLNLPKLEGVKKGGRDKILKELAERYEYEIQTLRNAWNRL